MLKMFTIRDQESQTHSPTPLGFPTVRDAKETLRELASDENTTIGKHPQDFQLLYVGDYDPRLGEMIPKAHESVCWANELLQIGEGA
jgi:hypothetical protein